MNLEMNYLLNNTTTKLMESKERQWFFNLDPSERNRLSMKYRGTYAYRILKEEAFVEMYNNEYGK